MYKLTSYSLRTSLRIILFTMMLYGTSSYSKHEDVFLYGTTRVAFLTHNSIYITTLVTITEIVIFILKSLGDKCDDKELNTKLNAYILSRIADYLSIIYFDILTVSNTLNTIVSSVYWGLYLYDKKLVFDLPPFDTPEYHTSFFTDVCQHLAPFIYTSLSLYDAKKYERWISRKFLFFVVLYYSIIISCCRRYYGNYPYPILNLLNEYMMFFCVLTLTLIADLLNRFYYELDILVNKVIL